MPGTAVETALAELAAATATLSPQLEGLRDFTRLNLEDSTRREVDEVLTTTIRRVDLLGRAKDALQALLADGHPDLLVRTIDVSAFQDLRNQAATIAAALLRFNSDPATTLGLTAGTSELKP